MTSYKSPKPADEIRSAVRRTTRRIQSATALPTNVPKPGARKRLAAGVQHGDPLPAPDATSPARLIRLREVMRRTGVSKSFVYTALRDGRFPRPVRLGLKAVGFIEQEINDWISNCIATSRTMLRPSGAA